MRCMSEGGTQLPLATQEYNFEGCVDGAGQRCILLRSLDDKGGPQLSERWGSLVSPAPAGAKC